MKNYNLLLIFSISIVIVFSINSVSALTDECDNLTLLDDDVIEYDESYSSLGIGVQENYVVNQRNFGIYFNENNILKPEYSGKIINFNGKFENKGTITINGDNTKITGRNTLFNNTVFYIKANGVMLTNLNFTLNKSFKDNNNAGIYISGDNVTIYNNHINYNTSNNIDAIAIYSHDNCGVSIINNTISYIGNAFNLGHNYGMLLLYSDNGFVIGNNINSTLPLREVDWSNGIYGGVGMDKVSSFVAGNSKNLEFRENTIYSSINHGKYANNLYPTLSSVLIYACDNSTINKNNIQIEDLFTRKNQANYLYGLDIYCLNDVTIVENTIDIFTYGGYEFLGTAYPIQVTGPAYNIKVAFNNLHSVSNGPNIGIYSQNYYGLTQIDIISNFINITGKASSHQWALVAGIEVQDSDDKILNNTIVVNTVGGYKVGDKIYGISYSQNTQGNHKYDIRYNNVTVPGPIAISLNQGLSSITSDTHIMYNILITGVGEGGDKAVSIGGIGQNNIIRYNTNGHNTVRHISKQDLPEWILSYNDGSNNGNGIDLSWLNNNNKHGNNELSNGEGHGNGLAVNNKVNGNNHKFSNSNAVYGEMNSTYYNYGESGANIASASSSAGSGINSKSGSSNIKSYEVSKKIPVTDTNYLQTILGIIFVLLLLIVGYEKNNHNKYEY